MNSNLLGNGKFANVQTTGQTLKAGDKVNVMGVGAGVVASVTPHTINVIHDDDGNPRRDTHAAHKVQRA